MFFNILKKDLKRKKTMNVILLVFIILCTTFLASSANNMFTTLSALDYFEEKTNGADYYLFSFEKENIENWINSCDQVVNYEFSEFLMLEPNQIELQSKEKFSSGGTTSLAQLGKTYNIVLDKNNEPLKEIKPGEIALANDTAKSNNLKIGDSVTVKIGNKTKTFQLTNIVKDMAFGTSYMGISKIIVSTDDYNYFVDADNSVFGNAFLIETSNVEKLEKDLKKHDFALFADFSSNTVRFCYVMDMMIASILMIVSICLILIALVVLRFTIGFTIQEDFREIGIMKAIGMRNKGIKGLYVVKYFAISVVGTLVGVIFSVPFGNLLMKNIQDNVAMESSGGNLWINLLCGVLTVLLVVGFCYLSASKVNKFTAIQAIRNGSSGERFKHKSPIKLHKRKNMVTILYMALNDIFSSLKSFSVLIVTFILGTLMVIIPTNSANTLTGDDCLTLFGMTQSDVYISNNKTNDYLSKDNDDVIRKDMNDLENLYRENGVDIDLVIQYMYRAKAYTNNIEDSVIVMGMQGIDVDESEFSYIAGVAPKLENEIAMTERAMEKLGVCIGDNVHLRCGPQTKSYIITASYQTMMNMGDTMRFSSAAEIDYKNVDGFLPFEGRLKDRNNIDSQIEKLRELSPQCTVRNRSEYLSVYLSSIVDSINSVKWMIIIVILLINCLITILMTKTLMTKDIGEIALLKNIGFTDYSIKLWQALRVIIILAVSIFVGVLLSHPLNSVVVKLTFGMMGAKNYEMNIVPLEIYLLYPLVLFVGTALTVLYSVNAVNKINLREVNNME